MIWFLRILFACIFGSMLWVTSWASMHTPLFDIPKEVVSNRWFIATLVDAYWGFLTFYVWVAWKEVTLPARSLWFIAVMLLGNLAMSAYVIRELFAVNRSSELDLVFTRRNSGKLGLPGILVVVSIAVYALA
jgi:predicted permease